MRFQHFAEATIEANHVQALRDDAKDELADHIRWTNSDGRAHLDGPMPESMEISWVAGWYVRHFMSRANFLSRRFRDQGVDRVRFQVAACGGWIVSTVVTVRCRRLSKRVGRRTDVAGSARSVDRDPSDDAGARRDGFRNRVASSLGVTARASTPTRAFSPRQLPTDHDHAVPTREYQNDQSSRVPLGPAPAGNIGLRWAVWTQYRRATMSRKHELVKAYVTA